MSKARQLADLNATSLADLSDNSISGEFQVGSLNVGGTEVIDSSRNLSNVGGLKTVNGNSLVGSGDISAGASTTYNAVGTYVFADRPSSGGISYNSTYAGSGLRPAGISSETNPSADNILNISAQGYGYTGPASTLSGTWRAMGDESAYPSYTFNRLTLFVRIS